MWGCGTPDLNLSRKLSVQVRAARRHFEEQKQKAKMADQKKLRTIWKKVDVDGSGELDWDELKQVFKQMCIGMVML